MQASDLSQCAAEPIRVPGAIQPHGRLVALHAHNRALAAYSANWGGAAQAQAALNALPAIWLQAQPTQQPMWLGMAHTAQGACDVTLHASGPFWMLEFEPAAPQAGIGAPLYKLVQDVLPKLQKAQSVQQLAELAVSEMKQLTGFGRCLIYRFDVREGHGEVLAEALDAGYDSYAGHSFPADDVPPQARALYLLNPIRLIADAHYQPVPICCVDAALAATHIDLGHATLRSVSPVHLEYMRNMRTQASMSVSLIVNGRLWGLVSCHDHEPQTLPYQTRIACEHLGRLLALQIEGREDRVEIAERSELRQLTLEIVAHLADSDASLQQLVAQPSALLRLARATGAAVVLNDQCWTVGETPEPAQIHTLAAWLASRVKTVYAVDHLSQAFAPAQAWNVAGVMALSISQVHRHLVLWFRPEVVQSVRWAGKPDKQVDPTDGRVHPRLSFQTWVQMRRGRSAAWSAGEQGAAVELRQALIGIVLRRAEELAEVATELGRVNKELEAFSYTVSHDLRAPMRHIAGYVDLVLDLEGAKLGDRAHRYLAHVKEASAFAGHLVDALLDFSRMGRSALKRGVVDTATLVEDLVREQTLQEPDRAVEWLIEQPLPALWGDAFLLQVALRNLLSNAVKYTRQQQHARVAIHGVEQADGVGIEVRDNGVGFQMKYANKLFGVFQRLHQAEEFEGTGIGLASVRRIVERHGGRVWAQGEPGQGATFGFVVPRQSTASQEGPN